METYSHLQLDALRELANVGSGSAATALSVMLRRPIEVSVPRVLPLPFAEAVDAVGPPEAEVTAVVLPIAGDVEGMVVLLFDPADAATVCGLLGVESGSEWGRSALAEIGNILGSSYIGAFGALTGLAIEPRPPETACDVLGAIAETALSVSAQSSDLALLLDSRLAVAGAECSFAFLLVATAGGIDHLLACLELD